MRQIVFPAEAFAALKATLLSRSEESCALLLASPHEDARGGRYVVMQHEVAPDTAYLERSATAATLAPGFLVPIVQKARAENSAIVFVHTHPGPGSMAAFSRVDDAGELVLGELLARRVPDVKHFAMVLTPDACAARVLGTSEPASVVTIGPSRLELTGSDECGAGLELFDRQVRIFGSTGQRTLRRVRVAVVGCGGTGSIACEHLAHLGIGSFILVDPDAIEPTNLNRVVGASPADVARPKVEVAADMVRGIAPDAEVEAIAGDVLEASVSKKLLSVDAIFSCTDSNGSRALLNQLAYQYLIPVFDVGVAVIVSAGITTHITGRVQMLSPGLGCLVCAQALDWRQVRIDFQSEEERRRDPYIVGHAEPQPAIITVNGIATSLATTMFLAAITDTPSNARLQYYNGVAGTVRSATIRPQPGCVVCSGAGAFAQAARWPLPLKANG